VFSDYGRSFTTHSRRFFPAALVGLYLLGVLGFTGWYVPGRRAERIARWERSLDRVVDDRHIALERWVVRVRTESDLLASHRSVRAFVEGRSSQAQNARAGELLADRLAMLRLTHALVLGSAAGRVIHTGGDADSTLLAAARDAFTTGRPSVALTGSGPQAEVLVAGPVLPAGGGRPIGSIVIAARAAEAVFPLLAPPTMFRTGQVRLIRRSRGSVEYLSPLSAEPPTARAPDWRVAASLAADRETELAEMVDARGRRVMAMAYPVTGTPWWVLAQVDRAEVLDGFGRSMAEVAALWILLFTAFGAGVLSLWWGLRRATTLARLRERARFAELLDHARDAIVILGRDQVIQDVNAAAESLFARSRSQLIGQFGCGLWPPDQQEACRDELVKLLARGEAVFPTTMVSAAGERLPVEVSARVANENGDQIIVAVVRDMRDAMVRRTALAEAETRSARNAAALEQAAEAAIITDPAGTIVDVNPAFERITGYRRDEVLGQNPRLLKSGRHDPPFYERMWAALGRGEVFSGEVTNRTKSGALYTAEVVISPVRGADGQVVNYVSLQRDVTHERALDAQLRQAQKIEAIGEFTGGIAHDFNNLLSIVLANVSLAAAEMPVEAFQIRGYLRDVEQATLRGAAMVRKLLAFSRRERLEMTATNLGAVVRDLVPVLRRLVPESIDIQCEVSELLPLAKADVGAFEQMIMNLATNARDAMPNGGSFTLRVERATIGAGEADTAEFAPPGDYILVSATDAGTGMDARTLARVFEPFFTTKSAGQGTGLGLAMVFGMMHQHQGFVRVESAPGKGSTFRLYFPVTRGAAPAVVARAPVATSVGGGETILLVEDEPMVRRAAARILERHGYQVVVAGDGEEGWDKFAETSTLGLLITDAVMPRLSGSELIARIRGSGRRIPCLMTSGYGPGNGGGSDGAADQILGKPWRPEELLRAVRELLDGRAISPDRGGVA
jgi:PAS domain S-box-containing protein